jgi:hypothetical protein
MPTLRTSALALSASVALSLSAAHICMWSPLQRSRDGETYNISSPGNTLCRNTDEGVCGGVSPGRVLTALAAGEPFDVAFQQNLNHFYVGNPGELKVDFANVPNPTEADFYDLVDLHDYNAMNEISQTNFTLRVAVPDIECSHCVLRLRYLSNNPLEPSAFYECADVSVARRADGGNLRGGSPAAADATAGQQAPAGGGGGGGGGGTECCAPGQFTMQGYETSSWRQPTQMSYYFDTAAGLQRIDSNSGSGDSIYDGHFEMYSNYSSGAEAYYNVETGSCIVYGLDYWNDWCFGSGNSEVYVSSVMVGSQAADVWQVPGSVFSWSDTQQGCIPVSMNRYDTGETTFYYNFAEGTPDAAVFVPPAACVAGLTEAALVQPSALPRAPHGHPSAPRKYKLL